MGPSPMKSDFFHSTVISSPCHSKLQQLVQKGGSQVEPEIVKSAWESIRLWYSLVGGLEPWNFIFHSVGNVIIPTDEVIFYRGVGSATNQ